MLKNAKFKKLISYYKPYKKTFFWDLLFAFFSASIMLVIPFIVRYLTDNLVSVSHDEAVKIILQFSLIIIFLMVLKFWCDYFTLYYGHLIGAKMEADMRSEVYRHYQKMSFEFFDDRKTGDLLTRVTTDLNNISELLHHLPEELCQIIIRCGGVIIIFFVLNIRMAMTFLLILVIMTVFLSFFFNKMQRAFIRNHEKLSDINSQIEESIAGARVTKAFANENVEIQKFEMGNMEFVKSQKNCLKIMGISYSGLMFFVTGILPIVAISGLILLHNNQITTGTLITFLLAESVVIGPIFSIFQQIEMFQNTMAGFYRFCEILETKPNIMDSENAVKLQNISGNIEFKNVTFHYTKTNKNIFENLNLKINVGEYIALVGSSGVGKSTLCNLIPRFYDVLNGEILIDGINVKNIKLENLRQNIGFVQQDTFLFSGTVMENIRYGNKNASDEKVVEAAKNAYAHDFIMSFSEGYNTFVGQRGLKLSGGQKQRLAIARAFLKNPPILIFDEATSNLDNESERYIQKSMEKLAQSRTTVVIAHRLSTIKNAKRILVMHSGKITEEGTHKELLAKNGVYAEFYNLL
ncbi:MAG: ABC transporter ATP-binding protein/permease [Oscillospiraceae bacterium]|jgi:ATP-binding cassette subfamily B protein|nr:ABC transporter ATP-binding protein/permease [Oscillospiraceae bacterium]